MPDQPEAPAALADDDLVTAWGLVLEGVARASRPLTAEVELVSGRSGVEVEVLFRLLRTPGHLLATSQLAHEVSFSSGGFTKVADRLVAAGLVERRACPTDRRVIHLALTAEGEAIAERTLERHVAGLRRLVVGSLGSDGVAELAGLMRTLRDAAGDDDGDPARPPG